MKEISACIVKNKSFVRTYGENRKTKNIFIVEIQKKNRLKHSLQKRSIVITRGDGILRYCRFFIVHKYRQRHYYYGCTFTIEVIQCMTSLVGRIRYILLEISSENNRIKCLSLCLEYSLNTFQNF